MSDEKQPTVASPVEPLVSSELKLKGTHPYSFRCGEWAIVKSVEMHTPEGLEKRPVYVCEYPDGVIDYVAVFDKENYELA